MAPKLSFPVNPLTVEGRRALPVRTREQQATLRRLLRERGAELHKDANAPATVRAKGGHWDYWEEFCNDSGVPILTFAGTREPTLEQRSEEEDALMVFMIYCAEYPRDVGKQRRGERNTTKYACEVVSTIRRRYEDQVDRTVGLRDAAGRNCAKFKALRKSLNKNDNPARPPRQPILAKHMRALHAVLDLKHSHRDRAFWCLALSCWLGVRRVGDFLCSDDERKRGFRPRYRSHRARWHLVPCDDGHDLLVWRFKPLKEDTEGRDYVESVYRTGSEDDALSGGNAWRDFLSNDPTSEGTCLEMTPLFRDDRTGEEYGVADWKRWVAEKFALAGLEEFGTQTHSFRIGGATTLAELDGGAAAKGMGGWVSEAALLYVHMSRERRVELAGRMAGAHDIAIAPGSRPVGRR